MTASISGLGAGEMSVMTIRDGTASGVSLMT